MTMQDVEELATAHCKPCEGDTEKYSSAEADLLMLAINPKATAAKPRGRTERKSECFMVRVLRTSPSWIEARGNYRGVTALRRTRM